MSTVNCHLSPDRTGPPQKSALQLAGAGAHLGVLEVLAEHSSQLDWSQRDDWGWTVLHELAHAGAEPHIVKVRRSHH